MATFASLHQLLYMFSLKLTSEMKFLGNLIGGLLLTTFLVERVPLRCSQVGQLFRPVLGIFLITTNSALATISHALVKGSGDKKKQMVPVGPFKKLMSVK